MKKLAQIFAVSFLAVFALSSCEEDEVIVEETNRQATEYRNSYQNDAATGIDLTNMGDRELQDLR